MMAPMPDTATPPDLALASVFPAATEARWRELVAGVLKGADFERKLVAKTHDGIRIEPLYDKAGNAPATLRAAFAPWRVAARVDHPEPAEAAALALAEDFAPLSDMRGSSDYRLLAAQNILRRLWIESDSGEPVSVLALADG